MSLTFRCPACGNTIQVADEHSGMTVQCPVCQQTFTAPRSGESFATPVSVPMTPPAQAGYWPAPRDEGRKGLAIAALVLGILGICIPVLPSLLAILLGVIALVLAGSRPEKYGGRGLAIGGIGVGAATLVLQVLFFSMMLPSLARARELAKRTACAANMSAMGRGLHVYANDGNQGMPIAAHWPEKVATATGQVNYVGRIGSKRGMAYSAAAGETSAVDGPDGREMSTVRNLWTLIRVGGSTPASFVCPSGDDVKNDESGPQSYWDFGDGDVPAAGPLSASENEKAYHQTSYGYQVPYGRRGRPSAEGDQRCVLAADKGPFGVAAEMIGKTAPPGFPVSLDATSPPDDWRAWNSLNHGGLGNGEGQNVLFADSHTEWCNRPVVGVRGDNIYTQWSSPDVGDAERIFGNAPSRSTPNLTPQGDTDSLIYP